MSPTLIDPEAPLTHTPGGVEIQNLSPTGIGDIYLGMPLAAAYSTGTLLMQDPVTDGYIEWDGSGAPSVCEGAGIALRSTPDVAIVWMDDFVGVAEIAIWPETSNHDVQTVEGLRLFDDFDRVAELYPDAYRDDSPNSNFYFVDDWGGSGNTLKVRDDFTGTVQGMSVRSPDGYGCYE